MLTVADTLKLAPFVGAQIVAGHKGLSNPVAWVHIASVPDAPQWLNGGELVLTTINTLPQDADEQRRYIEAMADRNVAGLVLSVGRQIAHAPDALRETAAARDFPLIEISFQARFVDIARATNEHISAEHMAMIRGALNIQQVLTQIVLDGGDLRDLATRLAALLGQSISIETERFEILASANIAEVDEARRFTVSQGRTDPRLVRALEERGLLPEIRRTLRPVQIPPMPDVGLELERILAPIVVHGDIYGYMWVIAHDHPLTDLDRMAISIGATVAALMLLYQESVQSAEASLKGSLLSQLIQGEAEREAVLTDQALRYGVDLTQPFVVLVIAYPERSTQRLLQLYRRVNRLATARDWPAVVGQFAGQVVVLLQADAHLPPLLDQIRAEVGAAARIGISGQQRGAAGVGIAHHQCREALHIRERLGDTRPIVYFDQLGYLHTLYRAGPSALDANPFAPPIRRLLADGQADLFATLEAYLDAGGNGVATAETLHIHRSTLNYRLERIREICGCDLSDPAERTNLQIALKLLRLFEVE